MELVEWENAFSVGHVLMDTHHRIFFGMVKEFSEQSENCDFYAIRKRIDFLAEYTVMHLAAEEKLMQEVNYPELENHKAIHEAFTSQVQTIRDAYSANPGSITAEHILKLMQDWFVHHIMDTDKGYMPYVEAVPN